MITLEHKLPARHSLKGEHPHFSSRDAAQGDSDGSMKHSCSHQPLQDKAEVCGARANWQDAPMSPSKPKQSRKGKASGAGPTRDSLLREAVEQGRGGMRQCWGGVGRLGGD